MWYQFVTNKDFNLHKKTFHSVRSEKCVVCQDGFSSKGNLKRHMLQSHRVSKDLKKSNHPNSVHICTNCGRNFADNLKLFQHHASHARSVKDMECMPANYNCPHCPKRVNRKRHMETHVVFNHSGDRPFSCEQCGNKFETRHCVNIHLRSHGIGGYSW